MTESDLPESNGLQEEKRALVLPEAKTEEQTLKTVAKTESKKPRKQHKTASKTVENTETPKETISSVSASTVSSLSSASSSSEPELSEADLEKHRERLLREKIAKELLLSGWSVREASRETGLPKSLIERLSKQINREETGAPRGGYRQEYLEKPYRKALESEEDDESLLDSGWIVKTQRKIWKLKLESDMMRSAGLIGSEDGNKTQIDLQQLLMAKILSGGQNMTAQELTQFAASLKNLFSPAQAPVDPISTFEKLEQIKQNGVREFKENQSAAFAQAAQQSNKDLLTRAIESVVPLVEKVVSQPRIPPPLPAHVPTVPPMPAPQLPDLPVGQILPNALDPLEAMDDLSLPEPTGYSNLEALAPKGKTRI